MALLAATLAPLVGCSPTQPQAEPPFEGFTLRATRGYIFISLDALRADHLGFYGYERETSPFMDSLAARSVVFNAAMAPYPSTLVSNSSLFTGLYPPSHGVYPPSGVLPEAIETLPEHFRASGFRTEGHTEGGFMLGGYGFARGFERYTDFQHLDETDLERTFGLGEEFLVSLDPDERFFLFLHSYVTHDPYDPPEPYRDLFWEGEPPPGPEPTGPVLRAINAGEGEVSPETLRYWRALYDASIRYADEQLALLFDRLEELGLANDTTVIITSDHGEEFAEHGAVAHTQIYPECLRIPLLIVHPDLTAPVRIPWTYSVVDIAPTLYELAGLDVPEGIDGKSLLPFLADPLARPTGDVYAEVIDRTMVRSLIAEHEGQIFQLLIFEPEIDPGGAWITRSVSFETSSEHLEFEVLGFHEPREVSVQVDGEFVSSFEARTHWDTVKVDLPPTEQLRTVTLSTPGCTAPSEVSDTEDARCLSFQVRGMPLRTLELYNLTLDPLASHDLSDELSDIKRLLAGRLQAHEFISVGEAESEPLSDRAREELRALGYLD